MKKIILFVAAAALFAGCTNDNYQDLYPSAPTTIDKCDTATNASTYSGNVKPLMDQYCSTSGCHDASTQAGGYDLSTYNGVRLSSLNGTMVKSIVWSMSGSRQMPQGGTQLTQCNLNQIIYWVNHGALNN